MTDLQASKVILPPAMLGIIGGGQLGLLFTIAARQMGYRVMVLEPDAQAPAVSLADVHLCAAYDDQNALQQLAGCAAVTTEFENVSADSMRWLAQHTHVAPSGDCVAITQDRETEKTWIQAAGLPTAPYQVIRQEADINQHSLTLLPGILKTATLGYDGKGQIRVNTLAELHQAYATLKQTRCVLEKMQDLKAEISVIIARAQNGASACFPIAENQHQQGILAYSIVPARLPASLQIQAQQMATKLAQTLNYVGVLAVELFVVGQEHRLIVNEMAPRPHNSGHYTLDACQSDQFQQQVRMMCRLPPASTQLLRPCCMANILGDLWPAEGQPDWRPVLQQPDAHLYLYGKKTARTGRKMGHFTILAEEPEIALHLARHIHTQLNP
ncbi:5-(carboxyamino)imidazole ribonucleotide synthase [Neisseriaceae bacterium ESL0693]|nr:5-(carboxyamino)imidazole ribonucleotide synthase [Neisseriaceae bacterium ESL0693]